MGEKDSVQFKGIAKVDWEISRPGSMLAPQDSIELAERISAWWQTFTVNLAGATATSWPPSIPERVATPFPRPMIEYELGIIVPEHDVTLADLLNGRITRAAMSPSTVVLRVQMVSSTRIFIIWWTVS